MPSIIIFIIILGIVVGVMTFFLLRSYVIPRRIAALQPMIEDGRVKSAIRTAKQMLARDPRNCDLHYVLGLAYLKEQRHELALMEFRTVNELGVFSEVCQEREFRRLAAELYERFGYPEEALKEHLLLAKLEPTEATNYFRIALLFETRQQDDVAAGYFRKTIELDPSHADAHARLGELLYRNSSTIESKAELEAAVKLQPGNHRAWFFLGRLLRGSRDYVGALGALEKAQRSPELKVSALIERGSCYLQMNSIDRAIIDLERAVRLSETKDNRDESIARYFLAACYEKTRRLEEAVAQWEKIYSKNAAFRDVAKKLSQYQSLRADDHIKDYLTASEAEFQELCRTVVSALGMRSRDVSPFPNGCQIIAEEVGQGHRATPTLPRLVRFLRAAEDIPESTTRRTYDDMKTLSIPRAFIVASSNFSRRAVEFAESRPIELIDRKHLQELLNRAAR